MAQGRAEGRGQQEEECPGGGRVAAEGGRAECWMQGSDGGGVAEMPCWAELTEYC